MTQKILNRRDTNDTATITPIALNASTSVKILDAGTEKVNVIFTNQSNFDIWIKFQAASVDDDKKGIILMNGTNISLVFGNGFYTGEVSAIAQTDNPTINVTEY